MWGGYKHDVIWRYVLRVSWFYAKETMAVYFEVFTFDAYVYNVEVLRIL